MLIVDEAHAYDAYMGEELRRLLQFHAALGGSAIVLSATLTSRQRGELAAAFQSGLGMTDRPVASTPHFPAAMVVSRDVSEATSLPLAPDMARRVSVSRIASADAVADAVAEAARSGAAVAWVRNAVDDAIPGCEMLRSCGVAPLLSIRVSRWGIG